MPGKRLGPSAARAFFVALVMPALLLLLLWGALPASAATFTVDDPADSPDADTDDDVCADAAGACTLRAAVQQANALAGADTIVLPAGTYTLTLTAAGDLDVLDDLTIQGAGANTTILDAAGIDRALHLWPGEALTVTGVTVRNGQTTASESGAGQGRGGGIFNEAGALFLDDVVLRGNAAVARPSYDGAGGALYNLNGTATLTNVLLEDNDATIDDDYGDALGGAVANDGGHLYVGGSAFLNNVSAADQEFAATGGALYNGNGGRATVDGAYFALNMAQGWAAAGGGAVHNAGGTITITASTVRNNNSYNMDATDGGPSYGGAIANDAGGALLLENVALSQNAALALDVTEAVVAGGLYNEGAARLNNVTLYHNILEDVYNDGGTVTLANSLAAGSDVICADAGNGGGVEDGGHNLLQNAACGFPAAGDLLLAPLADNGGATTPLGVIPTHALQNGSPALDAGHPAAPDSDPFACAAADQRGVPRPQDGEGDTVNRCDAGAFEADALPIEGLWVSAAPSTTIGAATQLTAGVTAGASVAYSWDLGDGAVAYGRMVSHTYPAVGVYTATVTVSNSVNLVTATATLAILDAPIDGPVQVTASAVTVEVGTACTFRARVGGGTGVTYTWDFDDGHTGEGESVEHTYAEAGEYAVTVTAANGVSEMTATEMVTVVRPEWKRLIPFVVRP